MRHRVTRLLMALTCLLSSAALVHAQGSTSSSLSGKVLDASGAAVPGATVEAKHKGTGATSTAVTSDQGTFSIPALNPGIYAVKVSLQGFKTVVLNDVVLNAAVPASVRATLEVGGVQEEVVVEAATEIIQTQATSISTTVELNQIMKIPVTSRSAMDFLPMLSGVNTPAGSRDSIIMGLPQNAINITLDGVNIQDNTLKTTDGFFAIVSPRLDAIEEVTLITAAQGAESGGQGAAQIRFVTRSGSNDFHGSVYHYFRHDSLNANTFFNNRDGLPQPKLVQNQPGFRMGGPVVIPGVFDGHNKLFFFVNYEELRQPSDTTRNRIILHPRAQQGFFRYNTAAGLQEVNLFDLAARNGQISAADPTIAKLLADIRAATGLSGSVRDLVDPLVQQYSFQVRQKAVNRYPTFRLDYNVSARHRLMASANYQRFLSNPDNLNNRDPRFPGFPITASQSSERLQVTGSLRSTLGSTLVNELRVGGSGAPVSFSKELDPSMWKGPLADQGGFQLNINGACCSTFTTGTANQTQNITNAGNTPTPSSRNASTRLVENTINWLKGSHNLSFGASFTQADIWARNQTMVPTLNFGVLAGDPADAMFNTTNFPGASTTNLTAARGLYGILVGRVLALTGNARINEESGRYEYLGPATQRGRMREWGFFAQDRWHLNSSLTLNFGLRYDLQLPFSSRNNSYSTATLASLFGVSGLAASCDFSHIRPEECNLFKPGVRGTPPEFIQLREGDQVHETDWNNFAPNLGIAWTPRFEGGLLRKLLGSEGESVIRAGVTRAYGRNGLSDFTDVYSSNPGILIDVNRSQTLQNLGPLPLLFRERDRLGPPPFAQSPTYPMTGLLTGDLNIVDPNLKVPYADTWTAGIQRALGKNMAIDVRYVGSRSRGNWYVYNLNEINVLDNGFLDEFRLAQANLQANIAAGRGANFRYFGPGTGTSPLPIALAYFAGMPARAAGDPANYASTLFASNTFLTPLARFNPNPFSFARNLYLDGRHANAIAAGLPPNFFLANPDLQGGANVTGNGGGSHYNGLAIELRRRFSKGLQFQTAYEFGIPYTSDRYSFRRPGFFPIVDSGAEGGVEHALKANWVWEVPIGKGRRWAGNASGLLDALIGGWNFSGTARFQSGRMVDFGNVRMVGFDKKDLKRMFKLRTAENGRLYMLPQDVIDNSVKAFSVSATSPTGYGPLGPPSGRYFAPANGPDCIETTANNDTPAAGAPPRNGGIGDCGTRTLVVTGPMLRRFDVGISKQFPLPGRLTFEFRAEMLNATNTPYFIPVTGMTVTTNNFINVGSNPDNYEVTQTSPNDAGRIVQLVGRVSW